MNARKAFSQYTANMDAETNLTACRDEIEREMITRKRLYDRWVAEGKCTWQEAHDRMKRILGALRFLIEHVDKNAEIKNEASATPF